MSNFIIHIKSEYWGQSIFLMEKEGKAFARIYRYNDDTSAIYLENLSVDEDCRRQGIGRELCNIHERIAKEYCAKTLCLSVVKDSWMHEWYIRRGYEDFETNENENKQVWMRKILK